MIDEVLVPFLGQIDDLAQLLVAFVGCCEAHFVENIAPDIPKRIGLVLEVVLCHEVIKACQASFQDRIVLPKAICAPKDRQRISLVGLASQWAVGRHARARRHEQTIVFYDRLCCFPQFSVQHDFCLDY